MSRANAPRRTILKGTLDFSTPEAGIAISIPVFVYKKSEELKKSENHLHHTEDGGRINYVSKCSVCDKLVEYDEIEKRVAVDEFNTATITKDEIDEVFYSKDESMRAIGAISLSKVINAMNDNLLMPKDVYEIRGFKIDSKKPPVASHERTLRALLAALEANKQALMVVCSLDSRQREALILPSGDVWVLSWEEEIREDVPFYAEKNEIDKEVVRGFKSLLKSQEMDEIAIHSAANMFDALDKLISGKVISKDEPAVTAKTDASKEALMKGLKTLQDMKAKVSA